MVRRCEQFAVQIGLPRQLNSAREKTAVGVVFNSALNRLPDAIDHIGRGAAMIGRHQQMDPAHAIDMQRRDCLDLAIVDRDEGGAFGAALANMTALKIAAKHDMWPLM